MMKVFEMKDLGEESYFFGIEIPQSKQGILAFLNNYAKQVQKKKKKIKMENCKRKDTSTQVDKTNYRRLIDCLLYLTTRPNMMLVVSLLSKQEKSVDVIDFGVLFHNSSEVKLLSYIDSDWTESCDGMRSTLGYLFMIGSRIFA
ncbi:ABC transporter C family member 9 [Gossypium australe]|uniref:ABC transporter C family member 9 n=1 Tax=Gossypium australe TaxID=47621 RepID=A0A5B6W4Q9_9ROSI|nr:ABC transporter C family member 9 [Gossypium australe]